MTELCGLKIWLSARRVGMWLEKASLVSWFGAQINRFSAAVSAKSLWTVSESCVGQQQALGTVRAALLEVSVLLGLLALLPK